MRFIYFAWVRERIGLSEEEIVLPERVRTVADVLAFLKERGEGYEDALRHPEHIRVAIDREHVAHAEPIGQAREIALFPPMTGG